MSLWGFAALLVIAILIEIDSRRSGQRRFTSLDNDEYLDEHDMTH
jgi:hypothetical protein